MHELPPDLQKDLWRFSLQPSHDYGDQTESDDRDHGSTVGGTTDKSELNHISVLSPLVFLQHTILFNVGIGD